MKKYYPEGEMTEFAMVFCAKNHTLKRLINFFILMRKYFIITVLLFFFTGATNAQSKHAFWDDVQTIKNYDKMYKAPVNPVLFVGSSSVRKWDDLQYSFAKYRVLNRGIGGSAINDIIYYAPDLIFTYQPRQIVLYVGENDIVNDKENVDTIFSRTVALYKLIRTKMPHVPVIYISIKPSPSRDNHIHKIIEANRLIRGFFASQKNTVYIDIFQQMLGKNGLSRPELFVQDRLHMNAQGYAIWQKAIEPYLLKD